MNETPVVFNPVLGQEMIYRYDTRRKAVYQVPKPKVLEPGWEIVVANGRAFLLDPAQAREYHKGERSFYERLADKKRKAKSKRKTAKESRRRNRQG